MSGPLRVALLNASARVVGGAETYLRDLVPALTARGHTVGLWSETDGPADRSPIAGPELPHWHAGALGFGAARAALAAWQPTVLFAHGLERDDWEAELLGIAPSAYFVHTYRGTCISGEKAHKFPARRPCARVFGGACLALFYPRRCGGLNPATMAADYARQRARLARLRGCGHIVTASDYMRAEYLRHGIPRDRVTALPIPPADERAPAPRQDVPVPRRLLWLGRMEALKGGDLAIDAAARASRTLGRPLRMTLLGDGRERGAWRTLAARLGLEAEFPGWRGEAEVRDALAAADLLLVSSVWPEPFGRVGIEAARAGVPVAAFRVGGIPEWLTDGVNGCIAPGGRPTAAGLARAIVECLEDPARFGALQDGARAAAARLHFADHVAAVERILHEVAARG